MQLYVVLRGIYRLCYRTYGLPLTGLLSNIETRRTWSQYRPVAEGWGSASNR